MIYVLELKYQLLLERCDNPFLIIQIGTTLNVLEWSINKSEKEIFDKFNHIKQDANQNPKYIGFADGIAINTLEWILNSVIS